VSLGEEDPVGRLSNGETVVPSEFTRERGDFRTMYSCCRKGEEVCTRKGRTGRVTGRQG